MKMRKVKRGEIYYFDFGINGSGIQSGARPAVVVQCDGANSVSKTVMIAPVTTELKKKYLPSHIYVDCPELRENSIILLEQIRTVRVDDLERYLGKLDEIYVRKINSGLKKIFDLNVQKNNKTTINLCRACLYGLINTKEFVIERADPYKEIKQECDICRKYLGHKYFVKERN